MKKRRSFWTNFVDLIIYAVLTLAALSCVIPILNAVAISFSDKVSASIGAVFLWPVNFNLASYRAILEEKQFFQSFWVSIQRVALGGGIQFVFTVIMAYPLSKSVRRFKLRNIYMWAIIFTMLFSGGLIPWYFVIKGLGMLDSIWALIIPCAVPTSNIIILMNFFKGLPPSIEESAMVDGANPLQILFWHYIPMSTPALATLTLFSIVAHWNSFFDGMLLINSPDKLPLQTYIQSLVADINQKIATLTPEEIKKYMDISSLTFNSAKIVVAMIPVLIIYPFLQRYFVTGLVMGAVKE